MLPALIVLFVAYVVGTSYQMRRALATKDQTQKLTEAKRLLFTSALGVPLLILFIFAV